MRAAWAANSLADHDEFAAKAAPTSKKSRKTSKPLCSLWRNIYWIKPPSLVKTRSFEHGNTCQTRRSLKLNVNACEFFHNSFMDKLGHITAM